MLAQLLSSRQTERYRETAFPIRVVCTRLASAGKAETHAIATTEYTAAEKPMFPSAQQAVRGVMKISLPLFSAGGSRANDIGSGPHCCRARGVT